MRSRMQKQGTWRHPVPAQEEGEPVPKQAREGDGDSPETDPEMPALESPLSYNGIYFYIYR